MDNTKFGRMKPNEEIEFRKLAIDVECSRVVNDSNSQTNHTNLRSITNLIHSFKCSEYKNINYSIEAFLQFLINQLMEERIKGGFEEYNSSLQDANCGHAMTIDDFPVIIGLERPCGNAISDALQEFKQSDFWSYPHRVEGFLLFTLNRQKELKVKREIFKRENSSSLLTLSFEDSEFAQNSHAVVLLSILHQQAELQHNVPQKNENVNFTEFEDSLDYLTVTLVRTFAESEFGNSAHPIQAFILFLYNHIIQNLNEIMQEKSIAEVTNELFCEKSSVAHPNCILQ